MFQPNVLVPWDVRVHKKCEMNFPCTKEEYPLFIITYYSTVLLLYLTENWETVYNLFKHDHMTWEKSNCWTVGLGLKDIDWSCVQSDKNVDVLKKWTKLLFFLQPLFNAVSK